MQILRSRYMVFADGDTNSIKRLYLHYVVGPALQVYIITKYV